MSLLVCRPRERSAGPARARPGSSNDRRRRSNCLQASDLAARTLACGAWHSYVSDLACEARAASIELAFYNKTSADADIQMHINEVPTLTSSAPKHFTERAEVGVVVNDCWDAPELMSQRADVIAMP